MAKRKKKQPEPKPPSKVGTLTRTKSLLAAALKVWELKQRDGRY